LAGKRRTDGAAATRSTPGRSGAGGKKGPNGKPPEPLTPKARVLKALKWAGITGLVLALLGTATFVFLYQTIEIPDPNDEFLSEKSSILYANGDELGSFAVQDRDNVSLDEISDYVEDAVVAAENKTFWTDSGIDPKGIIRAAFSNASGNSTQGASTITQQYVKILYLSQERSYTRKIKEAILSLKVQRQQSKEEVLQGYLNTIYYGRGAYGIQTAAQAFFDSTAKKLDLRQSAVLASVLNNPTGYDPANGKEARQNLKERYDYVLGNMAEMGTITQEEADKARRRLPNFPKQEPKSTYGGQKGHLLTMVRQELLKLRDNQGNLFTEEQINGGGLQVTTTFKPQVMAAAEQGVINGRPEGFGDKELHVGVASVEPGTGAVRGIYGGQDFLESQINWALAGGQAGSTLKAFAVAAGIKDGYSLTDTFDGNSPYLLPDGSDVENQGDSDYGTVSLLTATENSINTAFIDMTMGMEDGPEKIVAMANAMGIPPADAGRRGPGFPSTSPGLTPNIGVALGSGTVSPINMANGYATIANGGVAMRPYIIEKVVNAEGETVYDHKASEGVRAVSEDIAADTSYALEQVVQSGSGTAALGLGRPAAGKTGTATNDDGDVISAWFTGFTPQLATSVVYLRGKGNGALDGWLPSYFGGDYPAETWTEVMTGALAGQPIEELADPVYVDGEAPSEGHEPYVAPPPPAPTRKPSRAPSIPSTGEPSEEPSEEPSQPTQEPTQQPTQPTEQPTQQPTQPPPPTNTCPPTGCAPEDPATSNGNGNGGPSGKPTKPRVASTATEPRTPRRTASAA
jgi:membrane peptidoglycan carboxypeptidase